MNACAVKVKDTVSTAKEPSTSICSRLSGISGGRAIYTAFPAENYGAVTRREARGIEGAAQKYNGHLWLKYPHNSRPLALICRILEEFAMKCTHTKHSPPGDFLQHAHSHWSMGWHLLCLSNGTKPEDLPNFVLAPARTSWQRDSTHHWQLDSYHLTSKASQERERTRRKIIRQHLSCDSWKYYILQQCKL